MTALLSEKAESKTESAEKPDIVVCLQESTLNPHQFDFDAETIPPFSMFNKQEDTAFVSPLRVHTLGGATWKSEFAFLAGVPSTDFGALASGVFYSVVPHTYRRVLLKIFVSKAIFVWHYRLLRKVTTTQNLPMTTLVLT